MQEKQVKIVSPQEGFQEMFTRSNVDVVFGGGVLNCGKAQPLDSHVLTPNGFVRMGDLKVGDVVCGSDGGEQRVLQIHERGELETCVIEFDDDTMVECCPEHLWSVFDLKKDCIVTIAAEEIEKDLKRYTLPLPKDIKLAKDFFVSLSYYDRIRSMGYKVPSIFDSVIRYTKENKKFRSFGRVGKKKMRCILVSNEDHLYITDGFNLTHNTYAAILSVAEPTKDSRFRACFTRRTFGELKTGGGMVDDFSDAYGTYISVKKTDPPRVVFPSGAFVDFRQINDESVKKVTEQWKGSQYDFIYMDELTSYEFSTFKYLLTRNRGKADWTGKFRGTTNPEKNCWVRKFIDWYIGSTGHIREDRNGIVRYFYLSGETVDDVVWGDTKEEVYEKCKLDIDTKIISLGSGFTYKNLIKSFCFYLGRMSENKASIGNNMDYAGSVAAVGGRQGKQLVEGNWNVSSYERGGEEITPSQAMSVFSNDEQRNNDLWITADLADTGTDNTVILVWNGLHVFDIEILCKSTPRMNADKLKYIAEKHNIADDHIVYDGIRAAYVKDYIPDAVEYISYRAPMGKYGRAAYYLKDESYLRLVECIKKGRISFSEEVAKSVYIHQELKNEITVMTEFVEECSVVGFHLMPSGKKKLNNKRDMNQLLGKNRSMDLLDCCAMRMFPLCEFEYGQELIMSAPSIDEDDNRYGCNIYDNRTWF